MPLATPSDTPLQNAGTAECDQLLAYVSPGMYRHNAFRVLGLRISATIRDATRQLDRRRMLVELGHAETGAQGRLELKPPVSTEELRAAETVFHDSEQRLIHELFWFWPLEPHSAVPDPALEALQTGDVRAASKYWESAKASAVPGDPKGLIAKHNMAVRWQLKALDAEQNSRGTIWEGQEQDNLYKLWRAALRYWDDCIKSDVLWNAVSARAIALDDERLSLQFVQSVRKTSGMALLKLHAELALQYAETGNRIGSKSHADLACESELSGSNPTAIQRFIIDPIKERVRQVIAEVEKVRDSDSEHGDEHAKRVIHSFTRYGVVVDKLGGHHGLREIDGLSDEVASQCLSSVVAFHQAKSDDAAANVILETALPLARSDQLRERIRSNLRTGRNNILWEMAAPLIKPLSAVEESKLSPQERLRQFIMTVEPLVDSTCASVSESSEVVSTIRDRIARLLRNISVDAWNVTTDAAVALDAIGRADKYAVSAEVKTQLGEDRATLVRVHAAKRREIQVAKTEKAKKYAWGIGIAVVIGLIIWANADNSSSPSSGSPATSAAHESVGSLTSSAASGTQAQGDRMYSIPTYMSAELSRERAAAVVAQEEATTLQSKLDADQAELESRQNIARDAQNELEALGSKIERERPLVSNSDEAALHNFNAEVARYNQSLSHVRQLLADANRLVDPYNESVERARQKSSEAGSLVDAYNKQLDKYGH